MIEETTRPIPTIFCMLSPLDPPDIFRGKKTWGPNEKFWNPVYGQKQYIRGPKYVKPFKVIKSKPNSIFM